MKEINIIDVTAIDVYMNYYFFMKIYHITT